MELYKPETLKDWISDKTNGTNISEGMSIFLQVRFSNSSLIAVFGMEFGSLC